MHIVFITSTQNIYNSSNKISEKLQQALKELIVKTQNTLEWFNRINSNPADKASKRIWKQISQI